MDLTFIHVRKPQEVFEKGSKGTGRRRGLPAPLDPMLPFKPLKGPFPGGTEVPRVAQQSRGTRLEGPTQRSQTRASRPSPHPVTPHGDASPQSRRTQGCTRTTHLRPPPGSRGPSPVSAHPRLTPSAPSRSQTPSLAAVSASPRKTRLPAPRPSTRASQTAASAAPFRLLRRGSRPRPASQRPAP